MIGAEVAALDLREAGVRSSRRELSLGDRLGRDLLKGALFGRRLGPPRVGRYQALRIISSGGMGVIYEALDEVLERRVALKLLRGDLIRDHKAVRERVLREAQAMARLSHPNVVQVYEQGEHEGDIFLAIELVEGQTLEAWVASLGDRAADRRAHCPEIVAHFVAAGRGLAAAHALGLVHRDVKPANILLGVDGRLRLADFGLAHLEAEGGHTPAAQLDAPVERLTRIGTVLGTTAYMAPEQLAGARTDARSDQFSFCVALYEALYAERPFPGDTVRALRASIDSGAVRPAAPTSGVPAWLRAVLLRGLSADPAARYPDMEALLEALLDDLDARRRRRWAVSVATVVVAVLLVLAGDATWKRWQAHLLAEGAAQTIAALEVQVDALRAGDQPALAAQHFEEHIQAGGLDGSAALSPAWLREARQREYDGLGANGQGQDPALQAFLQAFITATSDTQRAAALLGVSQALHQRGRLFDLNRLLRHLERDHPEALETPEAQPLRIAAALAILDLDGARRLAARSGTNDDVRAVLDAFSLGLRTPYAADRVVGISPLHISGRERPGFMLGQLHGDTRSVTVLSGLGEPPLAVYAPQPWEGMGPLFTEGPQGVPVPLGPLLSYTWATQETAMWVASETGALVKQAQWAPTGHPLSVAVADLDADGEAEIYVGQGEPRRGLMQITPSAGGWTARDVGDALVRGSDVAWLRALDTDGDGDQELVASIGPWSRYDLRILELDPDTGQLRTLAREKLGYVHSFAFLPRPGRSTLLAAKKADEFPNIRVFPEAAPYGQPEGLYLLEMQPDGFRQVGLLPPFLEHSLLVEAADIDGDGLMDLVEDGSGADGDGIRIFRQHPDGTFGEPVVLMGLRVQRAMELDGDPGTELSIVVPEFDDRGALITRRLWIFGMGSDVLPINRLHADELPPLGSPVLERIRLLASVGLVEEAAEAFARAALALDDPALRAQAALLAASLYEESDRTDLALPLYIAALVEPLHTADGLEGALRCDLDTAQLAAAIAAGESALAAAAAASQQTRLEDALAELRSLQGAPRVVSTFDGTALPWEAPDPALLQRTAAGLRIHSHHPGLVLEAPVWVSDSTVVVELELSVHQLEWSAGLEFRLVGTDDAGDDTQVVLHALRAMGGGGLVRHDVVIDTLGAGGPSSGASLAGAEHARRVAAGEAVRYRFRCQLSSDRSEGQCAIYEGGALQQRGAALTSVVPTKPGLHTLRISTVGDPMAAVEVTLHALRLSGVSAPVGAPSHAAGRSAAVLSGDLAGVLAQTPDTPDAPVEDRVLRAELLLRLGQLEAGRALLRDFVGAPLPAALGAALRRRPALVGPALQSIAPHQTFTWLRDSWGLSRWYHPRDLRSDAELLELLAGLDAHTEQLDAAVARDLLRWRGLIRERLGSRALASADLSAALGRCPPSERDARVQLLIDLAEIEQRAGQTGSARRRLDEARALDDDDIVEDWIAARAALEGL